MHLDKYTDPDGTLECMVRSDEAKNQTARLRNAMAAQFHQALNDVRLARRGTATVKDVCYAVERLHTVWNEVLERNL